MVRFECDYFKICVSKLTDDLISFYSERKDNTLCGRRESLIVFETKMFWFCSPCQ